MLTFRARLAAIIIIASSLSIAASSQAMAAQASWWCHNGTCCAMSDGNVTRDCAFDCTNPNGESWNPSCQSGGQ